MLQFGGIIDSTSERKVKGKYIEEYFLNEHFSLNSVWSVISASKDKDIHINIIRAGSALCLLEMIICCPIGTQFL